MNKCRRMVCMMLCLFLFITNSCIGYAAETEVTQSGIQYPDGAVSDADAGRVGLSDAWKYADGSGINVAVIDGGANLYDPDINPRIKGVYNAKTGSTAWSSVHDVSETHGTNCAKILLGVAPKVNLYIIKAGGDSYIYTDQVVKGLQWAKSKGCRVISMSFGGDSIDQNEYDAIDELYNGTNSALVCASGGNSGVNKYHYAASFDNTLGVGAVKYDSGAGEYVVIPNGTYNDMLDVVAPGGSTSASTPFAAGVAALVFSAKPSLTAKQCRSILQSTAKDLGAKGKDVHYGYGLVQPYKAVLKALGKSENTPSKPETIKLSAKTLTLIKGQSKTLKVTGTTKKVTWTSNKKSVAVVSSNGKVTAKAKGTATITAKVGSSKVTCKVTVETPKISKTALRLTVKQTATLKVTGTKQTVKWSSSNKNIAAVNSSGKVTGKKAGTATIAAKVGTKKYTCKVTVENPKLNKTTLTLTEKQTATLKVTGTKQTVKWSSSNKSIATVNSSGKVTGKKAGTATITAKVGTKKLTCKVTVKSSAKAALDTSYKKLKNYVNKNGGLNKNGNRVIQISGKGSQGDQAIWLITYDPKTDKFTFGYQYLELTTISSGTYEVETDIIMDVNVSKNAYVSPDYGLYIASSGVEATAKFKAASYTGNKNVKFSITRSSGGVTNADIQDIANTYLRHAFSGWEVLLKRAGVSMKKIGFTSYRPQ